MVIYAHAEDAQEISELLDILMSYAQKNADDEVIERVNDIFVDTLSE